MVNILLFLGSCALIAGFTWWLYYLGQAALTAWIAILSLLANLFVLKQIDIFGFNATASDIFAIGSLLSLNLLQEKWGQSAAQHAIWASFGCLLFFVLISQVHLLYLPSEHDVSQSSYEFILLASPRLLIASLATFLIVDQFDTRLYEILRQRWPQIAMIFISGMALCISQLLDTLLFSFLGLYGMISAIVEVMVVSYFIKLIAIMNTIPWSFITQRIFKIHYAR